MSEGRTQDPDDQRRASADRECTRAPCIARQAIDIRTGDQVHEQQKQDNNVRASVSSDDGAVWIVSSRTKRGDPCVFPATTAHVDRRTSCPAEIATGNSLAGSLFLSRKQTGVRGKPAHSLPPAKRVTAVPDSRLSRCRTREREMFFERLIPRHTPSGV